MITIRAHDQAQQRRCKLRAPKAPYCKAKQRRRKLRAPKAPKKGKDYKETVGFLKIETFFPIHLIGKTIIISKSLSIPTNPKTTMFAKDFNYFVNTLTSLISYASKCKLDKDRVEAVKAAFAYVMIHQKMLLNTIESQATVSDRYRKFYDLFNSLYQKSYEIHNDMIRLHIGNAHGISLCRRLNLFIGYAMTYHLYCEPRTTKKFMKNPYTQSAVKPSGAFPY